MSSSTPSCPVTAAISASPAIAAAVLRRTFFSLYAVDADTVTVMLVTPASNAARAPCVLGTSAHHTVSSFGR